MVISLFVCFFKKNNKTTWTYLYSLSISDHDKIQKQIEIGMETNLESRTFDRRHFKCVSGYIQLSNPNI